MPQIKRIYAQGNFEAFVESETPTAYVIAGNGIRATVCKEDPQHSIRQVANDYRLREYIRPARV